jgi:DNA-binding transcriptional LysR family regulator
MNFRLLRYFLTVVDAGSVTAASRVLYVAQPSLSRQLRRLETDLGFGLFDRSDGRLRLTAAGRAFLPVARDLVSRAEVAQATAQSLAHGADVWLTVAGHPTTVADVIAPFIVAAGADGLVTNVVETSAYSVYNAVEKGDADLAIGTRVPSPDLQHEVVGRAFVWAECPPEHPLAAGSRVDLEDLVEWPLIVMHDDHGVRRMFDEAITREGLAYRAAHVARTPNVAQALAAAGRGVCVVSDDARFGLRELPIQVGESELSITLFGAWDPTHYAAETIRSCVAQLRAFTHDLYQPNLPPRVSPHG